MIGRRAVPVLLAAIVVLLPGTVLGPGIADAAWSTSGSGSATAKAGVLAAPTGMTVGSPRCAPVLTASLPITWTATPGAVSYQVDVASSSLFGSGTFQTFPVTQPSYTVTRTFLNSLAFTTVWVRTRAVAGSWVGPDSATVTGTLGPCLL